MLDISLVPMLRTQRDLYDIPRGRDRFRRYLEVMTGGSGDIVLPLSHFNPMGKPHVADRLDELIAFDAEALALAAIEDATRRLGDAREAFRLGIVLADDAQGGWTNRAHTSIENWFRPNVLLKRGWAVVLAWSNEAPTALALRKSVLAAIDRTISISRQGEPRTLGQMMAQEGSAAMFAGETRPGLDPDEIEYTREVIRPHREATDLTTIIPCLFGDGPARALGNDAFGLSEGAGLALAVAEALEGRSRPGSVFGSIAAR